MALRDLVLPGGRIVPKHLLEARFSRGGGPGGQHVNKVATKVDLRVDLPGLLGILREDELALVREKLASRLDADGKLFVISNEHREQHDNLDAALSRVEALLRTALHRPKTRKKTRPTSGSRRRRLEDKKHRGDLKRDRGQY